MYNRIHEMFNICTAEDSRDNDHAEGFANYWAHVVDSSHCNVDHVKGIPASSSQTVLFKPWSGILNQRKYVPIRLMPITIELSLTDDH